MSLMPSVRPRLRRPARVGLLAAVALGPVVAACSEPIDEAAVVQSFGSLRAVTGNQLSCTDDHVCTIRVRLAKGARAGDIAAAIEVGEGLRREDLTVRITTTRRDDRPGATVSFTEDVDEGPVSEVLHHVTKRPALGAATVRVHADEERITLHPAAGLPMSRSVRAARRLAELGKGMPTGIASPHLSVDAAEDDWPTPETKLFLAALRQFPAITGGILQRDVVMLRLPNGVDTGPLERFVTDHAAYDDRAATLVTSDPRLDLSGSEPESSASAVRVARILARTQGWSSAVAGPGTLQIEVADLSVARSIHRAARSLPSSDRQVPVDYATGRGRHVVLTPDDAPLFDLAQDLDHAALASLSLGRDDDGVATIAAVAAEGATPRQIGTLLARAWPAPEEMHVAVTLAGSGRTVEFTAAQKWQPTSPDAGDTESPAPDRVVQELRRGWTEGLR